MYADTITGSMRRAIEETERRRAKQVAYNEAHGITPTSIIKAIDASLVEMYSPEWAVVPEADTLKRAPAEDDSVPPHELPDYISNLRREMMDAADKLDYERAAELRDRIKRLERQVFGLEPAPRVPPSPPGSARTPATTAEARPNGRGSRANPLPRPTRSRGKSQPKAPARQGRLKLTPDRLD
jgi:excinuclease ABC subunit B